MDPIDLQIILHAVDEASNTVKTVENATASLGETAKVASEHAGKLGEAFSGLLQGVAVGIGITAAADAINSFGEAIPHAIEEVTTFGQEVLRMDRQTGASAETSSALLAVFERYGVSADQASRSLGLFARNLNTYADSSLAAQSKSTGFAGAIDSLGIHVKDANGNLIPMSEQLLNVADKFQAMPDGVQKTADAMALFGRSGKDMILVLNQGRDGMQEAMDTAAKYGLVLSGDTIEQVRQFGLAHKDLDEAMKGVTLQVGVAVIPLLAKLAEGAAGLAQGFNETVMPAIKGFGDAIDKFTSSEAFQTWSARLLVVVGLIGDGIGALSGVFFNALGGILDVVNTVGQAIYQGLQWLNPFAAHSPPLVSQVQDGVTAINTAYGSLGGLTATFDGIGTSFEALGTKTADFSSTVDDVATKTEKALAVMGPGVTDAFNSATDAVEAAKDSLADIKSTWDDAAAALVPLKDNLDAAREGLKDQQSALSDLKGELTGAQAAYDPLNNALKDATQNAKNAQSAIQALTSAPIAGSAAFDTKIADANIAIKQQALALNDVKQSSTYQSLGAQIDSATAKLKGMQQLQAASQTATILPFNATPAQKAAATKAANDARAAIQQQAAALADLKTAQSDLLAPEQKRLTVDQAALATINLQRDATIGVAQIQIKQAGQAASSITEKTPAEILSGLSTAGADKAAANAQVAALTPEVASALANVNAMKAKIAEQTLAVQDAQAATAAANTTYTDAKTKVDDLGKAYRDTKAEIAGYDAQLKQTIATGDMQVQKIKAAEAAAKSAAAAAGKAHSAPGVADDTGAESISKNLGEAKQKAEDFSKAVDQAKQDVAAFFQPVSDAADALGKFLAPLGDLGHWLTMAGVAFAVFTVAAGPVGAILGMIGAALALLLSPIGLIVLGVAALGIAIATNFGGIRTILQPAVDMFVTLQDRLKGLADVLTTAFQTGGFEGLVAAVKAMLPGILDELGAFTVDLVKWALNVGDQLAAHVLLWAGAFLDWVVPLIPQVITALFALSLKIIDWISSAGSMLAEHLGKWAAEFVAWIIPLLPKLGVALERITGATIDFIFAATPKVLGALASWAGAFLGWVLPALPGLLAAVGALVIGLTVWLVTVAVPKIAAGLVEWGKAFVEWVSPLIPPLLIELGTLAIAFIGWIADRVPELVAGFLDWATAFIAWISPMIVPFLAALETLAVAVLGWIGDKSKDLVLKLLEWGAAFISWIAPQVVPFLDELATLSIALIGWIVDRAKEIGDKIATEWGPAFLGWIAGTVVPGLAAALAAILDAILAWITGTALPWIATNLTQLGTGIIDAISAGFSGLGAVLRGIWEGVEADLGAGIHYSGTKGLTWTGPTLSIPTPSLPSWAGGGAASTGGGASGATVPIGGGGLPTVGAGAPIPQNGPVGGVPNTTPNQDDAIRNTGIVSATAKRIGATPADVAQSICGPEAYAALSAALGHAVSIDEAIAYSQSAGWTTAGMGGPGNMTKLLAQQNIPAVQTDIDTARKAVAGGGYSAVISTPGHYLEANSTDPNSGKFNVGDSGTVIGAGTQVSAGDLLNNKHAGPITGVWLVKTSGGDAPSVNVPDVVDQAATLVAPGGNYDPSSFGGQKGSSNGTDSLISKTILDAKNYADQLGISIDDANKILLDHGRVAQAIFGTQLPAAADISDLAVEKFADRVGVSWDTARAALTAGGAAADAVMGTGIPDAAQASSNAVADIGNNVLWQPLISNAALAGKDLKVWLQETGASAIDVATASLADLEKASGLSLPQMQRQADAAGKDLKTWLQETGVPAAQSLAGALDKMGASAGGTVLPLNDANAAAGNLSKTFITGNPAIDSFSAALAKIPDQAKAAAQSYRDLVTAMDNNLASSGPGGSLRQAASVAADIGVHSVMDASGNISTLSKPYASMTEDQKAAANRFSLSYPNGLSGSGGGGGGGNPSPSGSGSGGSSSGSSSASPFGASTIGSSGPGGKYNNPATGQPYTHAAGGPIYPNKPYLVGEQGPELIVPSHAGMVNPAGVTAALNTAMSNLPRDLARTSAVLDHLRDTFKAIPSNEQITVHLNTLDAQRNLKSLNDQVASTIAPQGDMSGTAAAQHMHVARPGSTAVASNGATGHVIDYDKLGAAVARAMQAAPAPRVYVEEIRSKLINIGNHNGGIVGLA